MSENKKKFIVKEYADVAGAAAFFALTVSQVIAFGIWLFFDITLKTVSFSAKDFLKSIFVLLLLSWSVFFLIKTVTRLVIKNEKMKIFPMVILTLFIVTSPSSLIFVFYAPLYAVCLALLLTLLIFSINYFYGVHERRLYFLIGIFALLTLLMSLNRASFWCGEAITFLFLSIQLVRNIITKRKNISDKSWRNTLLLFCILIIIMLMPQYCNYNNITHTLYKQSVREQLSARFIVPYVEYEKTQKDNEYLLGVIERDDFTVEHPFKKFREIIYRYEQDNLDMDVIWDNLYKNSYYRYRKDAAKKYIRDFASTLFSVFTVLNDMKNPDINTTHGYYVGRFSKGNPVFAYSYFRFGMTAQMVVYICLIIQTAIISVVDFIFGKNKIKIEEGNHRITEAILLMLCTVLSWGALQTLFGLDARSLPMGAGTSIVWFMFVPFVLKKYGK